MDAFKSKVYVLPNEKGYILRCEGGYTMCNIEDISKWVYIDEGTGDRYNHCQCMYFEKPIITDGGAFRYKLVDGMPVECTPEEIAAQEAANKPAPAPSDNLAERVATVESDVASLTAAIEKGLAL